MEEINLVDVPKFKLFDGEKIPCIGMGTFGSDKYTPEQVANAVYNAIKVGYRMFDCASVYGNEDKIGLSFEKALNEGLVHRDELFITSKVWNNMHGRGDVHISLAQSLKDLRLDYIDAYFVHWPFPNYHAPGCDGDSRNPDSVPFSAEDYIATWRQLERLHRAGFIRHLGMSNMTIPKLSSVLDLCKVKPSLIEMELHPCFAQIELFKYCKDRGIQPIGYCPIGSPNRPERDRSDGDIDDMKHPAVMKIAQERNISTAAVCLKWAVNLGAVPIPFSVTEKNYTANLKCITEKPLTKAEMKELKAADNDCRLIKGQVFLWPEASDWRDLWDQNGKIKE